MLSSLKKLLHPVLDPIDRVIEVLGGLIMVLTFTSALSVTHAGQAEVQKMLVASIGCNLAWGIIDAIMYLMNCLARRGRDLRLWRRLLDSTNAAEVQEIFHRRLPSPVAAALIPAEIVELHSRLRQQAEPPAQARLTSSEWLGALGIFLLVFFSTFPAVLPFVFIHDPRIALRISNAMVVVLLFFTGYIFAHQSGRRPWPFGLILVLLGSVLAAIAIAAGG